MPIPPPKNLGIVVVPERYSYLVERFGRFQRALDSGLHLLIPFVDRVAYVQSLKEHALHITQQSAITRDNVSILVDAVLYIRVADPVAASYGVDNAQFAVLQLAQTTLRSELGAMTLDSTFSQRAALNANIVAAIKEAATAWGLECLRCEVKDLIPPPSIVQAMEMQAEAERRKRSTILNSEGERSAKVNIAEGQKQEVILSAEAAAQATLKNAEATATALQQVGDALHTSGGAEAARLRVAEKYVEAFHQLAKESTTMLLPQAAHDPASLMAQAMSVYKLTTGGGEGGQAAEPKADPESAAAKPRRRAPSSKAAQEAPPQAEPEPVFTLRSGA